jgi:hypothetical protein
VSGRFSARPKEPQKVGGDANLGTMQGGQEQARLPRNVLGDEMLRLAFQRNSLRNRRHRDLQQRYSCLDQFLLMDGTMPIVRKFLEDMPDASLGADHGITGNAQALRQRIRRLETNTMMSSARRYGFSRTRTIASLP